MNRFRISTPEGTRDLLFSSCRALRQTENAVRDALEERGYSEIITPAVEYFDVFAQANPRAGSGSDAEDHRQVRPHLRGASG